MDITNLVAVSRAGMTFNLCSLGMRIFLVFLGLFFNGLAISADTLSQGRSSWITPSVRFPGLQQVIFDSSAVKTRVSYFVYVPPGYASDSGLRYPVLYWLHGSGGGVRHVVPLSTRFNDAIKAAKIPAMIVVFPNGLKESMWSDSSDGQFPVETVFIKELIPHVDRNFRTRTDSGGRVIEGFSMGGYGAARLAFKYPDMFGAVSILGAGPLHEEFDVDNTPRGDAQKARLLMKNVWGDDQSYFKAQSPRKLATQNSELIRSNMLVRLVIGDRDELLQSNIEFENYLTVLNIPHDFMVVPGVAHSPDKLIKASEEATWGFYRAAFAADQQSSYQDEGSTRCGYVMPLPAGN